MKPYVPLLFVVAIAASPAEAAEGTTSASTPPAYAQSFQDLDVNRDGVLSPGEYAQIHR